MATRAILFGGGLAAALVSCTALLGDDFEVVSATPTATNAGVGGSTGGTGGTGTASTGGGAQGGTGGSGGGGGAAAGPGSVLWESAYGDGESDSGTGIAYLSDGSLVVGGFFEGSLDFGGPALVSGGGEDAFVARIRANGSEDWSKKWGEADAERIASLSSDGSNGIFLFGLFADTIDFGSPDALTSVDESDLFAAKITDAGDGLWAKRMGSTYIDTPYHVWSGPGGEPAFAGTFQDAIDVDSTPLTGPSQIPSTFITRLSGIDGQVSWAEVAQAGGYPETVRPTAIAVDPSGNVAFFGYAATQGTPGISITYDGTTEDAPSDMTMLVLYRTDSTGALSWHERFAGSARGGDISSYPNGDLLACGNYQGSGDFAAGFSLPTSEGRDVWVARYGAAGTLAWARRYGGSGVDGANGFPTEVRCEALSDGSYVLVARSDGPFDVGGTTVPGSSDSIVIAHVAANGDPLWTLRTSGPGTLRGTAVATGGDEVALLVDFDGSTGLLQSFDAAGGSDIYLARVAL